MTNSFAWLVEFSGVNFWEATFVQIWWVIYSFQLQTSIKNDIVYLAFLLMFNKVYTRKYLLSDV